MPEELASANVNRSYSLAGTSIAIFTFMLFFMFPRFKGGEVNPVLFQAPLVTTGEPLLAGGLHAPVPGAEPDPPCHRVARGRCPLACALAHLPGLRAPLLPRDTRARAVTRSGCSPLMTIRSTVAAWPHSSLPIPI